MKIVRGIGLYVLVVAALTCAATLGWLIPRVARHGVEDIAFWLEKVPVVAAIGAAPLALVFLVFVRKHKRESKVVALLLTSGVLCLALAVAIPIVALYPGHTQYGFLRGKSVLYSLNPGLPGYLWDVYCFQGDLKETAAAARRELEPLGYHFSTEKHSPTVRFTLPGESPDDFLKADVSVSPGRVTGHHFHIDGDFAEQNDEPGWVTVDVQRPDPMPLILRMYVK